MGLLVPFVFKLIEIFNYCVTVPVPRVQLIVWSKKIHNLQLFDTAIKTRSTVSS